MIRLVPVPFGIHQARAWRDRCICDPRFDGAAHVDCPTHGLAATLEQARKAARL